MTALYTPIEMIEKLVGFDTTSAKPNTDLIDFAEDYLASHGLKTRRTSSDDGRKANLFASLGPAMEGGVVLSGHTDVVPVDGQPWDSDPFQVVEKDRKLYGRGTSDMKSFLAVAMALVPEIDASALRRPLHLALSYDEEVGCLGIDRLIADIQDNLPLPAIVVVGEPTSMRLVNAHKGCQVQRTTVTGLDAHSSQSHRGASAILAAGRLVSFLAELAEEKKRQQDDARFEPPHTTFNVGLIEGGTALNIIPRQCSFVWEFRALPDDDPESIRARFDAFASDEVLPKLRETAPQAEIVTERMARVPPLRPESDSPAEDLVRRLTGANECSAVAFGTEAGLFQEAGMSTVVCGPGSIDQAHQPNEFIDLSQVEACRDFIRKLAAWAAE
jgi:acetylornithine deacetylase